MLSGKTVLLGVTGGVAAYKSANLASLLLKQGAAVEVVMTANATRFIAPMTFEAITGRRCMVDTFDRNFSFEIEHIALAKRADLVLIAPASANVLAKLAHGLADDMLTTTVLACRCPKLVAPAMNTGMYENPVTQRNLELLRALDFRVIAPAVGRLACGDVGSGKMPPEESLVDHVLLELAWEKDLAGRRVLVTAGPTREAVDPVRFLTNHSSGKMGYAIARAAMLRGAAVTLVSGPTALPCPPFLDLVRVQTAREMFEAVTARSNQQDIIIKAAAVADFRPAAVSADKIKKTGEGMEIRLEPNPDILQWLGEHRREGQFLCGFAMETRDTLANARDKLRRKRVDMIAANSLREEGAGFQGDTNILTLVTEEGDKPLPQMSKDDAAHVLLDRILQIMGKVNK